MPSRPSRRRLTGDEYQLWAHVTADAQPLHPLPQADPVCNTRPPPGTAQAVPMPAKTAQMPRAKTPSPGTGARLDGQRAARLARGKLQPQARIDLHGMTLAEAQPALASFLIRSRSAGLRLVLVITGKGNRPDRRDGWGEDRGILRRQVPHWLGLPPNAAHVVEMREAHRRHGGAGALYVWLRRPGARALQPRGIP